MKNIVNNDNVVRVGSAKITTKYPIQMIKKIKDKYIILLNIPSRIDLGVEELNNVLCYNEKGEFCWRISNQLPVEMICKDQMPYVMIRIEDEELYVTDFWERRFKVDIENGDLINVKVVH